MISSQTFARVSVRRARRPRVVLDTNVVFSGLYRRDGPPFEILHHWHTRQFELILSQDLNLEYHRIIDAAEADRHLILSGFDSRLFQQLLAIDAIWTDANVTLLVRSRDPDDDRLLQAAMGGQAAYLVTGDNDLLVLDGDVRLGTLRIVRPAEFLVLLQSIG